MATWFDAHDQRQDQLEVKLEEVSNQLRYFNRNFNEMVSSATQRDTNETESLALENEKLKRKIAELERQVASQISAPVHPSPPIAPLSPTAEALGNAVPPQKETVPSSSQIATAAPPASIPENSVKNTPAQIESEMDVIPIQKRKRTHLAVDEASYDSTAVKIKQEGKEEIEEVTDTSVAELVSEYFLKGSVRESGEDLILALKKHFKIPENEPLSPSITAEVNFLYFFLSFC